VSDVAPGSGWWKASDGNWYPPRPAAQAAPAPAPPKSNKGCLIAVAIVGGIVVVGAVLSIVAITFLGHKVEDKLDAVSDAVGTPELVDPTDPSARPDDHVTAVGEGVRVSGYTATVSSSEFAADARRGRHPAGQRRPLHERFARRRPAARGEGRVPRG
jgi:hypothetical protein